MASGADISSLVNSMEDYALYLKAKLPTEQQAIIDALVLAEDVRRNRYTPQQIIARLRGAAMVHKQESIYLASHMELLANELETKRIRQ